MPTHVSLAAVVRPQCSRAATAANTAAMATDNSRQACRQPWNVGPAHRPYRTALDDAPTPTDQKVAVRVLQQMDRPVLKTYRDTADLATL